jgi:hypothetical protein
VDDSCCLTGTIVHFVEEAINVFWKIKIIGAIATVLLMAACYGGIGDVTNSKNGDQQLDDITINNLEESDLDGDLFTADIDCDDVNSIVYSSATHKY